MDYGENKWIQFRINIAFIDFAKAFDSVEYPRVVEALLKHELKIPTYKCGL